MGGLAVVPPAPLVPGSGGGSSSGNYLSGVRLLRWSPTADLVAVLLSSAKSHGGATDVHLVRVPWQRVWAWTEPLASTEITDVAWRHDGAVLAVATVTAAGPERGTAVRLLHVEGAASLARVVVGAGWAPTAQLGWRLYTPPQPRAAPSVVAAYADSVRALLPLPEGGGSGGGSGAGMADPVALAPGAALPLLGVWDAAGHWQLSLNGLFPYVNTDARVSQPARVRWRAVHPSLRSTVLVTDEPPQLALGDAAKLPAAVGALHPVARLAHHVAQATEGLRAGVARMHTAWNDVAAPLATVFDRIDSALQHIDESTSATTGLIQSVTLGCVDPRLQNYLTAHLRPAAWKRTDASVVRALFLLRQEVQNTLRPLATALDAHLSELLAWTAAGRTLAPAGEAAATWGVEAGLVDAALVQVRALYTASLALDTALAACAQGWTLFSVWFKGVLAGLPRDDDAGDASSTAVAGVHALSPTDAAALVAFLTAEGHRLAPLASWYTTTAGTKNSPSIVRDPLGPVPLWPARAWPPPRAEVPVAVAVDRVGAACAAVVAAPAEQLGGRIVTEGLATAPAVRLPGDQLGVLEAALLTDGRVQLLYGGRAQGDEVMLARYPSLLVARVVFASLPGQPPPAADVADLPASASVRAWAPYDDDVWIALITARRTAGAIPLGTAYVVVLEHARCGYASSLTEGAGVPYRTAVRQWRQLPGPVADGADAGPYVLGVSGPRGMVVALCPAGPTVPITATALDVNADDDIDEDAPEP